MEENKNWKPWWVDYDPYEDEDTSNEDSGSNSTSDDTDITPTLPIDVSDDDELMDTFTGVPIQPLTVNPPRLVRIPRRPCAFHDATCICSTCEDERFRVYAEGIYKNIEREPTNTKEE